MRADYKSYVDTVRATEVYVSLLVNRAYGILNM